MQIEMFTDETRLKHKFNEFHGKNPHIYQELVKLTRQAWERGRKKIGMQMLFEVIRWNRILQTTDKDFKLNNNYAAYYSRMIMDNHPEFGAIFETRRVKVT